jgi:hypothetical protein
MAGRRAGPARKMAGDEMLSVLGLGGCQLRDPLVFAETARRLRRAKIVQPGGTPLCFTFGEVFQLLGFLRGEVDIAPEIRGLVGLDIGCEPIGDALSPDNIDLLVFEPATPVEITFHGRVINQNYITESLLDPLRQSCPGAVKPCALWMSKGVLGMNDDLRARKAAEAIEQLAGLEDCELLKEVLLGVRPVRRDPVDGLRQLSAAVSVPVAVITYIHQYLPDGRPLSWPIGFREEIVRTAQSLGLPVMETWSLVKTFGVAGALQEDGRHYTDAFLAVIGPAIADFAAGAAAGN